MTGVTSADLARVEAARKRKLDLDLRVEGLKIAMRAAGHPVREDFASRAAYRTALSRFKRRA